MKLDINIKPCIELSQHEIDEYTEKLYKDNIIKNDSKTTPIIIKVPVYCVFVTYEKGNYFFNHIYSFIYTDGKKSTLLNIYDRNDDNEHIVITDKENSYAIIAIYEQPHINELFALDKEVTKVLNLVYNPNSKW